MDNINVADVRRRANDFAKAFNHVKEAELSSPAGLEQLRSFNAAARDEFAYLTKQMDQLYETLPDGRAIFIPDLVALRKIATESEISLDNLLKRSVLDEGRVVKLNLSKTSVQNLTTISELTELKLLNLQDTRVKDIQPLSKLGALQVLNLSHTRVKDLQAVVGMKQLYELNVDSTNVRDLSPLQASTTLKWLKVDFEIISRPYEDEPLYKMYVSLHRVIHGPSREKLEVNDATVDEIRARGGDVL